MFRHLLVAEVFIARYKLFQNAFIRIFAALILLFASLVLMVGTYYFVKMYWGPAILEAL